MYCILLTRVPWGPRLQASRNGATGVELDLSFTADGVAVLLHDDTVDRTTNGSGPISGLRLAHVKSLDAAARHRLRYGGQSLSLGHDRRLHYGGRTWRPFSGPKSNGV